MDDIVPGLLDQIQETFQTLIGQSRVIADLLTAIDAGSATYIQAEDYAYEVGAALAQALTTHLTADSLPDGRLYFNIADRVLRPLLESDHKMVSDAAVRVQLSLNTRAGLGLRAQSAPINADRIDGIINKVSVAENFDEIAWVLDAPVVNFSQSVVDAVLKANVEFQARAGMRPRIIRRSERRCCQWCQDLAGEYDYPDVPDDVYRRHENCRCTVDYDPGSGRRQNVHTKRWT